MSGLLRGYLSAAHLMVGHVWGSLARSPTEAGSLEPAGSQRDKIYLPDFLR